jgi:hypothetical protein
MGFRFGRRACQEILQPVAPLQIIEQSLNRTVCLGKPVHRASFPDLW